MEVVIYARFSPRKDADESESAVAQIGILSAAAVQRGWDIKGVFSDEGKSGATTEGRDGLTDALARLKGLPKGSALFVYNMDRLSRSVIDSAEIRNGLLADGHVIEAYSGNSVRSMDDKLVANIHAAVAEHLVEEQRRKTSQAMVEYQAKGKLMGRPDRCPYGKMVQDGAMVDDPEEVATIERARALYAEGANINAIRRLLHEEGRVSRTGRTFTYIAVRNMVEGRPERTDFTRNTIRGQNGVKEAS